LTKQLERLTDEGKELLKYRIREIISTEGIDLEITSDYLSSAGLFSEALHDGKLQFPRPDKSMTMFVWGVTISPEECVTACGCSGSGGGHTGPPYVLCTWSVQSASGADCLMYTDDPLADVTDLKDNDLVVLCRKSPILRIVNAKTKMVRVIPVNISEDRIKWLGQVAVDYRGHFLVTLDHGPQHEINVIGSNGNILHEIQVGCHGESLTLCKLTGMIVTCSVFAETITTHPWQGSGEAVSARHGVNGFQCSDICSGSLGEIFVVGLMKRSNEIRVYQVDFDDDEKSVMLHRVHGVDFPRMQDRSWWPRCSVSGSRLVICYGSTMRMFMLKP
jgi:hypothetical protein